MDLPPTTGLVIDVDAYVVTVLVGEEQEEWTFPLTGAPRDVSEGDSVQVRYENGRPVEIGTDHHDQTMQMRLTRPLNLRRLQLLTD